MSSGFILAITPKKENSVNTPAIYKIRNTINGKIYIGSSTDLVNRWRRHRIQLYSKKHHSIKLQNAWNKYGEDAFEFSILAFYEPAGLIAQEQIFLDVLKPEYNMSPTAGSPLGVKRSQDFCRRNGDNKRGKKASEESRKLMSLARSGKALSLEHREKIGKGNTGKVRTEDVKDRIRGKLLGRRPTQEARQKMSKAHKGKKRPDLIGRKASEETREKMRLARRRYLERKQELQSNEE